MQIARRTFRLDLGVDQPAQSDAQRRNPFRIHRRVGYQRDVGFQLRRILGDILRHRFAADLLFAFDQKLQIDRQGPVHRTQGLDSFDVHVHLPFVVGRTAGVNISIAQNGLKRRRLPQLQRIGRLHIVMPITQHRRLSWSVQPIGVNQRMLGRGNDRDVLKPRARQAIGDKFRGPVDVSFILRQRADARNPQKRKQLLEQTIFILPDKCRCGWRHDSIIRRS